jgi:integrase/recombinase XerD
VARVNITKQIKTSRGWRNLALTRDARGRIRWTGGLGRYLIEWRQNGERLRQAAGTTPAEALEAQKRKRLELEAGETGLRSRTPMRLEVLFLLSPQANFL